MSLHRRHEFHACMAKLLTAWSKALCDETNALSDLLDFGDPIIRRHYNNDHFLLFFASLRAAVETTSGRKLTIREPHPYLVQSTGIQGGTSTFVVCSFDTAEGSLDELPPGARCYHFDFGQLEQLATA